VNSYVTNTKKPFMCQHLVA